MPEFSSFVEILPVAVWLHGLILPLKLHSCISSYWFLVEIVKYSQTTRCLSAVDSHPSIQPSLLPPLLMNTFGSFETTLKKAVGC